MTVVWLQKDELLILPILCTVVLSNSLHQLYRGHSLFMIKVGIVTVLVALPSYYQATAGWAYRNRAIWPLIMSQLVTARHRGEVLFGLFSRAIATCEWHLSIFT